MNVHNDRKSDVRLAVKCCLLLYLCAAFCFIETEVLHRYRQYSDTNLQIAVYASCAMDIAITCLIVLRGRPILEVTRCILLRKCAASELRNDFVWVILAIVLLLARYLVEWIELNMLSAARLQLH